MTSDGGLILVRELDERLGFGELIQQPMKDSRRGKALARQGRYAARWMVPVDTPHESSAFRIPF